PRSFHCLRFGWERRHLFHPGELGQHQQGVFHLRHDGETRGRRDHDVHSRRRSRYLLHLYRGAANAIWFTNYTHSTGAYPQLGIRKVEGLSSTLLLGDDGTDALGNVFTSGLCTTVGPGTLGTSAPLNIDTDGTLSANSNTLIPTQNAVKTYVDAVATGLDWKASVRVATTANGTLATAYENGDTIDGVTLATGDRILLKNQTSGAENGIYVVAASGAPARATDANTSAEVTSGLACFVSEGSTNAGSAWVLTTADPITLGTTALVFAQFNGGSTYTADESTLHLSGTQFSVKTNGVGDSQIRQSAGLSVVGRSVNSTGNVADITAAND